MSHLRDETLRCWDVATGALKWMVRCKAYGAAAIAFSPDNRMLLLATRRKPSLGWDIEESEEGNAESDDHWITYIALSPTTGKPETSRGIHTVRLNEPSLMSKDGDWINAFAFSSDCTTLASGWRFGSIQVWDATTGLFQQTIKHRDKTIDAIAVSPDGSKIAATDGELRLWDAATGARLKVIDGWFEWSKSITFYQDSKKLLSEYYLYDLMTGTTAKFTAGQHVEVIAISPDNKILALAGKDIGLWDATMGIQEMYGSGGLARAHSCFAFSIDGKTVAYAKYNKAQIWNTATRECGRTIEDCWPDDKTWQRMADDDCNFQYTAIAFSVNGKLLALGSQYRTGLSEPPCQIQIWNTVTGECTWRQTLHSKCGSVIAVAFSPDGNKLAVGVADGMTTTFQVIIMLFDIMTGRCLWKTRQKTIISYHDLPKCFAFSPDGSMLASSHFRGHGGSICELVLWYTATGSCWQTVEVDMPDKQVCTSLEFSPDGRYLYIAYQCKVRLFREGEDEDEDEDEDIEILSLDAYLLEGIQNQCIPVIDGWIMKDGRRLLWVPEEYRYYIPSAFVCGNTVVLGHDSGITFIRLDL